MKFSTLLVIFLSLLNTIEAQKYQIEPASNTISFDNVNQLTIIGYEGNEIIFENEDYDVASNDRASGLRLINTDAYDNTKIGLSVENNNDAILVTQVGTNNSCNGDDEYIVKVPSNMNIIYKHSSWDGDDLKIKNISGEIEISTNYNDIYLEKVTGPMAIKTVYGSIEADFEELSQVGSVSLYSVYEYVDITIPQSAKSNINLKTTHGNIYSDMDVSILNDEKSSNFASGDKIKGTINGGGVDITITATYDNIYLRKTK